MPTASASSARLSQQEGLFEHCALEVMRGVRAAFLRLIESLPNAIHRAADLERALGISTTLAWQVHRVATSPNPLAAGAHVPGMTAVKQMLQTARSAGVPNDRLRDAASAMQAFDKLVAQHAGDRATFTTMINSLAGGESETIDLKTRRQAFRLNSQVWGVQVKTHLRCTLYHPGRSASLVDSASIRGMREIRRLRVAAPFRLSSYRVKDAHEHPMESHAIDEGVDKTSVGPELLLEYCSEPCPELENRIEEGFINTYLRDTPLGNAGVQTLYLADVVRDIEWYTPDEIPNYIRNGVLNRIPAEALVLDTLIHRNMFGVLAPSLTVLGSLDRQHPDSREYREEIETLPIRTEVHSLGTELAALYTQHVPRYPEMVESVCQRLGWDPNGFELFRCVLEYPILGSTVTMRFELPEPQDKPKQGSTV